MDVEKNIKNSAVMSELSRAYVLHLRLCAWEQALAQAASTVRFRTETQTSQRQKLQKQFSDYFNQYER